MATSACRRGEALGVRWRDIDFDNKLATFKQIAVVIAGDRAVGQPAHMVVLQDTTKGGESRTIELDAVTVEALRAQRARQAKERLAMGAGYSDNDLVFCLPDGNPLNGERISREFIRMGRVHKLTRIRLHDLRHTWATLALKVGVSPKVVQQRLGHKSIAITMNTYSHVTPGMQSDAAERVAQMIFGAQSS